MSPACGGLPAASGLRQKNAFEFSLGNFMRALEREAKRSQPDSVIKIKCFGSETQVPSPILNTPVRVGETIEGSRTMRNRPYPVLKCSSAQAKGEKVH